MFTTPTFQLGFLHMGCRQTDTPCAVAAWCFAMFFGALCLANTVSGQPISTSPSRHNLDDNPPATNEPLSFSATAVIRSPIKSTHEEDSSAAGSTLYVRRRSRALEDVSEAIVEVPGVRLRRLGGVGSPAFVSLRGAEVGHTSVLLGSVPMQSSDLGAFDLSVVPLRAFKHIEVYRGGGPAWYSDGAIGGVVRFVPESGEEDLFQTTLGYGSFGRLELRATTAVSRDEGVRPSWFGFARMLRADNDYAYTDDGQTRFDPSDDRELRQKNADILQGDALVNFSLDVFGGRVALLLAGHERIEGVPGPLAAPTLSVQRKLVRALAGLSYEKQELDADGERRYRLQFVFSGSHQVNSLTDRFAELGTSQEIVSDDVWQRGFARAAGSLRLLPFLETSLIASLTSDRYRPKNRLAFTSPSRPSERTTAAITFEPRFFGQILGIRTELRPSIRLQFSQTAIRSTLGIDSIDENQFEFSPTYRLALAASPIRSLTLTTSAATGVRLPSIVELFGDRAFQEANPELKDERSKTVDIGLIVRGRARSFHGSIETRGFVLLVDDLIRYERTSQFTVRPDNTASARIYGGELGVVGGYGRHLSLSSSVTAMHTRNAFGESLPLRPALQAVFRPQVQFFPRRLANEISTFAGVHHISFAYLDEANLSFLPGRTLFFGGNIHDVLGFTFLSPVSSPQSL